jgi:hypothetical protein
MVCCGAEQNMQQQVQALKIFAALVGSQGGGGGNGGGDGQTPMSMEVCGGGECCCCQCLSIAACNVSLLLLSVSLSCVTILNIMEPARSAGALLKQTRHLFLPRPRFQRPMVSKPLLGLCNKWLLKQTENARFYNKSCQGTSKFC